jgi:hypothetical protein
MKTHPVKPGDSVLRLERSSEIILADGSINIFRRRKLDGKGAHN